MNLQTEMSFDSGNECLCVADIRLFLIFYDKDKKAVKFDMKTLQLFLCHSKNKPPAMQGEDRSLDISMNSCAKIKVGLQNHK